MTIAELVDQLGPIEAALDTPQAAIFKAQQKRAAELRKQIGAMVKDPAEWTITVSGKHYDAIIGPREQQTRIPSLLAVYSLVKKAAFMEACTLSLKALTELVPDDMQRERLTITERTGPRPVQTFQIVTKDLQKLA